MLDPGLHPAVVQMPLYVCYAKVFFDEYCDDHIKERVRLRDEDVRRFERDRSLSALKPGTCL